MEHDLRTPPPVIAEKESEETQKINQFLNLYNLPLNTIELYEID
jgi:hypothetical protein